jgi:hypothetical protein
MLDLTVGGLRWTSFLFMILAVSALGSYDKYPVSTGTNADKMIPVAVIEQSPHSLNVPATASAGGVARQPLLCSAKAEIAYKTVYEKALLHCKEISSPTTMPGDVTPVDQFYAVLKISAVYSEASHNLQIESF